MHMKMMSSYIPRSTHTLLSVLLALCLASTAVARLNPESPRATYTLTATGGDLSYNPSCGWFQLKLQTPGLALARPLPMDDTRPTVALSPQQLLDNLRRQWGTAEGHLLLSAEDMLYEPLRHAQQHIAQFGASPLFNDTTNELTLQVWMGEAGARDAKGMGLMAAVRQEAWVVRTMSHTVTLTFTAAADLTGALTRTTTMVEAHHDNETLSQGILAATTLGAKRSLLQTPQEENDQKVKEALEETAIALTSLAVNEIPIVGPFLAALIPIFFKPSSPSTSPLEVWQSIKAYAQEAIKAAVDTATLDNMDKQLQGISGTVLEYASLMEPSAQKTQSFTTITNLFTELTPQFTSGPTGLLAYLIPFGTLSLGFRRELVVNYTGIYGSPDPNAAANHNNLKNAINTLSPAAVDAFNHQIGERMSKVSIRVVNPTSLGGCGIFNKDSSCGNIVSQDTVTGYIKSSGFDNNNHVTASDPPFSVVQPFQQHVYDSLYSTAKSLMTAHLNALTDPMLKWPLFDPSFSGELRNVDVVMKTGLFGGLSGTAIADQPASPSQLTSVTMHSGTRINGLQFSWGGVPDNMIGDASGSDHKTLTLGEGEYINRIEVGAGDAIDYLVFHTNKGRTMSGGTPRPVIDVDFSSPTLSVALCGMGGLTGTSNVQGISFKWCSQQGVLFKT